MIKPHNLENNNNYLFSAVIAAIGMIACNHASAFPEDHWTINPGEYIEVLRSHICFNEGKAGYRQAYATHVFSREVLSAEVMISGFNMWYTREGHDHEVMNENIDAWVVGIGLTDPDNTAHVDRRHVNLKFQYAMRDENTGDSDDYNDACIGYTVIARTK